MTSAEAPSLAQAAPALRVRDLPSGIPKGREASAQLLRDVTTTEKEPVAGMRGRTAGGSHGAGAPACPPLPGAAAARLSAPDLACQQRGGAEQLQGGEAPPMGSQERLASGI